MTVDIQMRRHNIQVDKWKFLSRSLMKVSVNLKAKLQVWNEQSNTICIELSQWLPDRPRTFSWFNRQQIVIIIISIWWWQFPAKLNRMVWHYTIRQQDKMRWYRFFSSLTLSVTLFHFNVFTARWTTDCILQGSVVTLHI